MQICENLIALPFAGRQWNQQQQIDISFLLHINSLHL